MAESSFGAMKKYLIKTILSLILISAAVTRGTQAQTVSNAAGNSWLLISPSTRNVGLGGALSAVPEAYDEVEINPAGIGMVGNSNFSISQNFWAQGLTAQHLVYNQTLSGDGFSLGADYFNFGNINLYTVNGPVITANGSYSPVGLNVYGGYGMSLSEGLRVGLTAHFIYDNIQQAMPDQTASFDGGLFYQLHEIPMSLSAVLTNLGWDLDGASLPTLFKTGWAYRIDFDRPAGNASFATINCLTLAAEEDWSLIAPTDSTFGLGGEYWYKDFIALRAGYRFAEYTNLSGLSGFSLGAGVRYLDWQLDYALTTIGDFGTSNQISLSLMIGEPQKTPTPAATVVSTPTTTTLEETAATPTPSLSTPTATPPPAESDLNETTEAQNNEMLEVYRKGILAYQSGHFREAAKDLKTAVSQSRKQDWVYAEGYAMLGIISEYYDKTRGHLDMARQYYQVALKLDPANKTAIKHIKRWKK
jgi:tetratricopeptide (TPR) repeat protein